MPLDSWKAQLFRTTVFFEHPYEGDPEAWIGAMGLPEPDTDEHVKREALRRLTVLRDDTKVEVHQTPQRGDIYLMPAAEPSDLGAVEAHVAEFEELSHKWLQALDAPVIRLAFGATYLEPAANRRAAYGRLNELLESLELDPDNSRDVFYQVNRPITVDGLILNRLTKWSSVVVAKGNVVHSPEGMKSNLVPEYFVRLECDNSTPADNTAPIGAEKLIAFHKRLVKLSLENVQSGEAP